MRGLGLGLKLLITNLPYLKVSKAKRSQFTNGFISGFCCLIQSLNSNGIHWWRLQQMFIVAQRQVLIVPVCWLNGSVAFFSFLLSWGNALKIETK